ncbi:hypothetical protein QVD17_15582 [Tagetes erecta]|uniref:Myb-like domain-containing protein n=1 Tax=Tagetes erecta TaxID=13708 RepID=A0AAD8NZP1_TARER|nr:hypothetical protein QVD17_15582 [Tagetes erecta]
MAPNKTSTRNSNGTITTIENIISAVPEHSPAAPSFNQNIGHWTPEEQSLLEQLLIKHASDGIVKRCAAIVMKLRGKTLDDVALRCRKMIEKAQLSTTKDGDEGSNEVCSCATIGCVAGQPLEQNEAMNQVSANGSACKDKAACEQVKSSSHATNNSNGLHCAQLSTSIDNDEDMDDEISYKAIGGAAARLLEQNEQAIKEFAANLSAFKLHENVTLGSQTRNNINALLYESLYNMPEMKSSARQLYNSPMVSRLKKI